MAIRVKARSGEGVEQMLRRFKKLCEKEGLTKDIKRKEFYEKPSERRRRAQRKAFNRRVKGDVVAGAGAGGGGRGRGAGGPGGGRGRGERSA